MEKENNELKKVYDDMALTGTGVSKIENGAIIHIPLEEFGDHEAGFVRGC